MLTSTKVSGTDSARVAKWGILLSIDGTGAFDTKYAAEDEAYLAAKGTYSVESSNDDKVVAPGTSSEQIGTTLKAKVTGQPEVATRYILKGTVDDIVLPANTYTDYTNLVLGEKEVKNADGETEKVPAYDYFNTFTIEKDYAPVKWNLVISKNGANEINVADALYAALPANLIAAAESYGLTEEGCSFFAAVNILKKVAGNQGYENLVGTALGQIVSGGRNFQLDVTDDGEFTLSYDFDAGKEMGFEFSLSWEWAFETELEGTYSDEDVEISAVEFGDMADTFLGNVAAGVVEEVPDGVKTTIGATLTATAVQID